MKKPVTALRRNRKTQAERSLGKERMTALAEMTKSGTDDTERRCIATGERAPKGGLIRFVIGPDNTVVPDLAERLPGRGIWVSADTKAMQTAIDRKLFARAAKAQVEVPADIVGRVATLLVKRCQDIISLARRSDILIVGYDRVLEALERGPVGLVAVSVDAGTGRHDVLDAAEGVPLVGGLTSLEMGAAAGKGTVAFLTLQRGGLADSLKRESERLTGIRPAGMDVSK